MIKRDMLKLANDIVYELQAGGWNILHVGVTGDYILIEDSHQWIWMTKGDKVICTNHLPLKYCDPDDEHMTDVTYRKSIIEQVLEYVKEDEYGI